MSKLDSSNGLRDANGFGVKFSNFGFPKNPAIQVPLAYYTREPSVELKTAKYTVGKIQFVPGGALRGLPSRSVDLAVSADQAHLLDADNDGWSDSFFLAGTTFRLTKPITISNLLHLDGVKVKIQDLTNHPDVVKKMGQKAGTWCGVVSLSGSNVSIPAIKNLALTAQKDGGDTWKASYSVPTGVLSMRIANAAYTTSKLKLAFLDSELNIGAGANELSLSGKGQLSLPDLGLRNLTGTLGLRAVNQRPASASASVEIPANAPLTRLGLSGKLAFAHDFINKSGSLKLSDARLAGIGVTGELGYRIGSQVAIDRITGQLTIDNSTKRYGLDIKGLDKNLLLIVPLGGRLDFSYSPKGSTSPGGFIDFKNIDFDLITGLAKPPLSASFRGNLKLALDASGLPSFKEVDLTLKNPVEFELGKFGRVRAEPTQNGTPVKFSLKSIKADDGSTQLAPVLTGKFTGQALGLEASVDGIAYEYNSRTKTYGWEVKNFQVGFA